MEQIEKSFASALTLFKQAETIQEQVNAIKHTNQVQNTFYTMLKLCMIRHTIDTTDEFYGKEQEFFDETEPQMEKLGAEYYTELVNSQFRPQLEEILGEQLFNLAGLQLRTFSDDIVPDLQRENKLSSEYGKLLASANILFKGEDLTLAQLQAFLTNPNRPVRKQAHQAFFGFFAAKEAELDRIFADLVKVRTDIARKLGYENYVELGYHRMDRIGYDSKQVSNFRRQVQEYIVPLAAKLREQQSKRIGVDKLKYYDEEYKFTDGNPKPQGSSEWIIRQAGKMYQSLSSETDEFFQFMVDRGLMDLVSKKNKAPGGYCTLIEDYKSPFIFANFNGTKGDIDALTHEMGHAFQKYLSSDFEIREYYFPTSEMAEVHAMGMEFFTWPWMDSFFGASTDKYKFAHLSHGILFLPYCISVDEFQHWVYENPEVSSQERKEAWRAIENKYQPWKDYDGMEYLEQGGFWQKQGHIYQAPFYYIDYGIAHVLAFQFWARAQNDWDTAWSQYVHLCKLGGSKPFLELLKAADLASPFEESCFADIADLAEDWLEKAKI